MRSQVHPGVGSLDPREWNALSPADHPFLRHEFLAALERTGCVGAGTGCMAALDADRYLETLES